MFWYQGNFWPQKMTYDVFPSIFWNKICRFYVILDVPDPSFITFFLLEELPAVFFHSLTTDILIASFFIWGCFSLHFPDRRTFSLSIEFGVASSFLSVLKYSVPFPSGFHHCSPVTVHF